MKEGGTQSGLSAEPVIGDLPVDLRGPQHRIGEMRVVGTIGDILRLKAKTGARRETLEKYVKRLADLEAEFA